MSNQIIPHNVLARYSAIVDLARTYATTKNQQEKDIADIRMQQEIAFLNGAGYDIGQDGKLVKLTGFNNFFDLDFMEEAVDRSTEFGNATGPCNCENCELNRHEEKYRMNSFMGMKSSSFKNCCGI